MGTIHCGIADRSELVLKRFLKQLDGMENVCECRRGCRRYPRLIVMRRSIRVEAFLMLFTFVCSAWLANLPPTDM